jgi:hypothetical protein
MVIGVFSHQALMNGLSHRANKSPARVVHTGETSAARITAGL